MLSLKIRAVMAANHGLITTPQLSDAGAHTATVRRLVRERALVAVRRGVYADGELWDALATEPDATASAPGRPPSTCDADFLLSHDSAAYEHKLDILEPPIPLVHVTRYGVTGAWTRHRHQAAPGAVRPGPEDDGRRPEGPGRRANRGRHRP